MGIRVTAKVGVGVVESGGSGGVVVIVILTKG